MPKIHYTRFPVTSPVFTGKLPTCYRILVDLLEFGKRHDTTDFCPHQLVTELSFMLRTCYREVANLLWTCYGETGVMNFGLYPTF